MINLLRLLTIIFLALSVNISFDLDGTMLSFNSKERSVNGLVMSPQRYMLARHAKNHPKVNSLFFPLLEAPFKA